MSASLKYLLVWTASIVAAAAVLGLLYVMGSHTEASRSVRNALLGPPAPYSAIIIGSSVTKSAFPPRMSGLGAAWENPVQRHSIGGSDLAQLLVMGRQALDMKPDILVIEIGPAIHQRPVRRQSFNWHLGHAAKTVRGGIRNILGGPTAHLTEASQYLWREFELGHERYFQGRNLHSIGHSKRALTQFLTQAHRQGVRTYFITFPRPKSARKSPTSSVYLEIRVLEEQLAASLDIPLFAPSVFWEDEHFADAVHLNRQGRARYISQFTAWLERQ